MLNLLGKEFKGLFNGTGYAEFCHRSGEEEDQAVLNKIVQKSM